jgi:hypothetical protein
MIITALLNLLYTVISFILTPLSLLGNVSLPTNFSTAITNAGGYYNSLNAILPMDTMLAILALSLAIEGAYLIYKLIMWVIQKIPTIN